MRTLHDFEPGYPQNLDVGIYTIAIFAVNDWNEATNSAQVTYRFLRSSENTAVPAGTFIAELRQTDGWYPEDVAYIRNRYLSQGRTYDLGAHEYRLHAGFI